MSLLPREGPAELNRRWEAARDTVLASVGARDGVQPNLQILLVLSQVRILLSGTRKGTHNCTKKVCPYNIDIYEDRMGWHAGRAEGDQVGKLGKKGVCCGHCRHRY
jgi:hypothetical protein